MKIDEPKRCSDCQFNYDDNFCMVYKERLDDIDNNPRPSFCKWTEIIVNEGDENGNRTIWY